MNHEPIAKAANFNYRLKRLRRSRTIRISVHGDASVVVTAPPRVSLTEIKQFVASKTAWILEMVAHFSRLANAKAPLGQGEAGYRQFKRRALQLVNERLALYVRHYGYEYNRVSIRNQKRSWGSCSADRNLNFNYRLFFLPLPLCDYIIVHELCHLEELNHSPSFWRLVEKCIPDYKDKRRELKKYIMK